jgi:hypothetical protein
MNVNDDDADVLVDETNKSSADDLSEKERASIEIDLMQNSIRKQLLKNQYRELWGEEHGYQSPNSYQQDIVADETDYVNKVNEDIVDKDETETDDANEDEDKYADEDVEVNPDDDESYVPGIEPDDNDEDEDDAVCDNNDKADDVGEDEVAEGVIETNNKKETSFFKKWVNNNTDVVSYYNINCNCRIPHDFDTVEGNRLGNWVHDQRQKFKTGQLSDDIINLLSDLQFDFSLQVNVVGSKLTVPVALSNIFKYKKEHGHISIPNKEPHKQLRFWITHASLLPAGGGSNVESGTYEFPSP